MVAAQVAPTESLLLTFSKRTCKHLREQLCSEERADIQSITDSLLTLISGNLKYNYAQNTGAWGQGKMEF